MTSFIQSQSDNHRKASEILTSIQVKLEVLAETPDARPFYKEKLNKELDKLYLQYHDVIRKIVEQIMPEEKYIGVMVHREDVVTIAEEFHA